MVTEKNELQCNLWLSVQLTWRLSGLYSANWAVFRCIFRNRKRIPGSLKYGRGQSSLKDVYCDVCIGGRGKATPIPCRNSQEEHRTCQVAKSWGQVNSSWKHTEIKEQWNKLKFSRLTKVSTWTSTLREGQTMGTFCTASGKQSLAVWSQVSHKIPLIVNPNVCRICKLLTITFYINYKR